MRIPRKRITNLLEKYKKKLKLNDCEVELIIAEKNTYKIKKNAKLISSNRYAEIFNDDYLHNNFKIVLYYYDDLEDTILHELLHIVLWKYRIHIEELIEHTDFDEETKLLFLDKFDERDHEVIEQLIKILK